MKLKRYLKNAVHRIIGAGSHSGEIKMLSGQVKALSSQVLEGKMLAAKTLIRQMKTREAPLELSEVEFKVFSQFGDDGIIQYLIHQTGIRNEERSFIEFGVQNYDESNTRFLLYNDNWRGLIMDGGEENMQYVRNGDNYWCYDLTTVCAFIDADNINQLLSSNGFSGDVGLLSIDIDGNDYWIWERISVVNPVIVVAEYNSTFGSKHPVTIPYDPLFYRSKAHYSNLYWGASLKALDTLARKKGYVLVGSNSAGNNAYFVRVDRVDKIRTMSVEEAYVESMFRESRNPDGSLSYISGKQRLDVIRDLPLYSIDRNMQLPISELYELPE